MSTLTQGFTVARPPGAVWAALRDTAATVTCLPGASLTAPPDADGALAGTLKVKLGPIAAAFGGTGRVAYDDATMTGTLEGAGADRGSGSRAKGTARFAVVAEGVDATRVTVTVDYMLAGMLAQFARGSIVEDVARRLVEAFAGNLEARLGPAVVAAETVAVPAAAAVAEPASVVVDAAPPPPPAAPVAELNLLHLLFGRLWARVRAALGLGPR